MVISPAIAAPNENANDRAKSRPAVSIPENAVQISDHVYYLGKSKDVDGKAVEGFMFVHPKNEPAKPDKPDKPDKPGKGGGGKKGGGGPSCFAFISKGAKWEITEPYVLDPRNDDFSETLVANRISASLATWNTGAEFFTIFGAGALSTGLTVDTSSPDGLNEVLFGDIDEPNVIASTIVWRTAGPPQVREFVEWDMIFDDPGFMWGDAPNVNSNIMDLQNIATHEAGHAAGMAHPDNSCTEETMYAFATEGEIIKQTLNSGDITGINQLYPDPEV